LRAEVHGSMQSIALEGDVFIGHLMLNELPYSFNMAMS
jgi:hypothetical protein